MGQGPSPTWRFQNRLWAAAKQSRSRRFHALLRPLHRSDVLWEAWQRVRANRGAPGVDATTLRNHVHRTVGEACGENPAYRSKGDGETGLLCEHDASDYQCPCSEIPL